MPERDTTTKGDPGTENDSPSSESRRQQAEKAGDDQGTADARDSSGEGSTTSRPRGHTEDPDTTL